MTYYEQYDIAFGIFRMFESNSQKKIMGVRHSNKKRDEIKSMFPYKKYEHYQKSVFILACLYVNFTKMPSSAISSIEYLSSTTMSDIKLFKDSIVQYRAYLKDDLALLRSDLGENIKFVDITEYYRNKKIRWYTWYFYILVSGQDIKKIENSRINGLLYKRIKTMLLFVTFSQDSMMLVKDILKNNISFA